jgi:hypothetical protein
MLQRERGGGVGGGMLDSSRSIERLIYWEGDFSKQKEKKQKQQHS